MNRRLFGIAAVAPETDGARTFGLILCASLFLCGCIVGVISAGFVSDAGGLSNYVSGLIRQNAGQAVAQPGFLPCFFNSTKYHIVALFFAFSPISSR